MDLKSQLVRIRDVAELLRKSAEPKSPKIQGDPPEGPEGCYSDLERSKTFRSPGSRVTPSWPSRESGRKSAPINAAFQALRFAGITTYL
eukprot:1195770-Prorocentrum_minimum.AAC.1